MSNVISGEGRAAVGRMYRARFMIAGGLVFIATAFFAGLALLPVYLALHAVATPTNAQSAATSGEKDRTEIGRAQAYVTALRPLVAATTSPSKALIRALELKGKGVRIDHATYVAGDIATIAIAGSADSPTSIDAYQKALEADGMFKNVSVPVGDLIGAKGGHFSMSFQGVF